MHLKSRQMLIPVFLILLILAAFAVWYYVVRPAQPGNGSLTASGTIEVVQVQLGPEIGGKVTEVLKDEGETVNAGDVLIRLDTALLEAQRAQAAAALEVAQANAAAVGSNADSAQAAVKAAQSAETAAQAMLDAAQSNLDLLQTGATAEQLSAARAQLAQAEAALQAAQASFAALTAGARPEDVNAARYRLDLAHQQYTGLVVILSSQQIEDVRSAVLTAETNLNQAKARQTELQDDNRTPLEALDAAAAAVTDAEAADTAAQSVLDAVEKADLPFYLQLESARKAWEAAQLYLDQAKARQSFVQDVPDITQAALDAASLAVDDAQSYLDDAKAAYDTLNTSDQGDQLKAAWDAYQAAMNDLNRLGRGTTTTVETALDQLDAASAQRDLASANLDSVQNGARSEQISAAQAQVDAAAAQLDSAKANIDAVTAQAKAAQSQVDAAQAQVDAAQAALDALDVQIGKMTLTSPVDGLVLTRAIEPGEIATPGGTLLTLARMTDMTITVYIPEDRYGEITIGQSATLTVDSFPDEQFSAAVVSIADQAEFTPRNVQTVEGRKTTVFAVKLRVEDPSGKLKPGMPADIVFK